MKTQVPPQPNNPQIQAFHWPGEVINSCKLLPDIFKCSVKTIHSFWFDQVAGEIDPDNIYLYNRAMESYLEVSILAQEQSLAPTFVHQNGKNTGRDLLTFLHTIKNTKNGGKQYCWKW